MLHRRPSVSLVVALVALFVALGGGAYAATTTLMGHNQLAPNSVWHNNIGKGSVHMDNLTSSLKAQLDKTGKTGATGPQGATGPKGPAGTNGGAGPAGSGNPTGSQGPLGLSGVNDPLVYTFAGTTGPDSGTCAGSDWATDTYDATYTVTPLADGSINVVKFIQGSFVTVAGDSPASCGAGNTDQVSSGRTGTFYGTQSYSIPGTTSVSADFNPTASCGVACSPDTAGTSNSSNDAQNTAFDNAFFNGVVSTGGGFDFVYHAGSQTWVDSNTPSNNQGDITG